MFVSDLLIISHILLLILFLTYLRLWLIFSMFVYLKIFDDLYVGNAAVRFIHNTHIHTYIHIRNDALIDAFKIMFHIYWDFDRLKFIIYLRQKSHRWKLRRVGGGGGCYNRKITWIFTIIMMTFTTSRNWYQGVILAHISSTIMIKKNKTNYRVCRTIIMIICNNDVFRSVRGRFLYKYLRRMRFTFVK